MGMVGMLTRQEKMRQVSVENSLRSHPGVRDAAVFRDDAGSTVVFVVPEDSYLSNELGRAATDKITLNKWRKIYDLSQLTKEAVVAQPGFNIAGWNSSYTNKPLPSGEIHQWVDATVASVLELSPRRVYEIGCGTGLLLTRIAPHCERYLAADFSSAVLTRLREEINAFPALTERVELSERQADNFSGLDADSFDTVVLNSVVQYFPSLAYLTNVLEHAVRVVKPGGNVYVGDVRSLPLLPAFATSVELFQATSELKIEELKARVRHRIEREKELVLSPAYFLHLQDQLAKVSRVEIRPTCARSDNEMTRYRFSAVLYVGHDAAPVSDIEFADWEPRRWTISDIRAMAERGLVRAEGIRRIKNARVQQDLVAMEMMNATSDTDTVGQLRSRLGNSAVDGIDPEDIHNLELNHPDVAVHLSWAAARKDGSYDALLVPRHLQNACTRPVIGWPQPAPHDLIRFANWPGQERVRRELMKQIEAHANRNLLLEKNPVSIQLVDDLVRDRSGEVDTAAMLSLEI